MKKKIVLLGAGSAAFSLRVFADFLTTNRYDGSEIVLVDIDEEVLEAVQGIAARVAEMLPGKIKISRQTDSRKAMPGADMVISTIAVGGYKAVNNDINIPVKYGVVQPIGDSVGPGGISRSLRTIPVMLDICHDMERLCPEAWLINYTNPMSAICMAVNRYTSIRMIGLCHGTPGIAGELAGYLGIPLEELYFEAAGVNHLTWFTCLEHHGEDMYPRLFEALEKNGHAKQQPVINSLLHRFGLYAATRDSHTSEFMRWYHTAEVGYGQKFGLRLSHLIRQGDFRRKRLAELRRIASGKQPANAFAGGSGESAVDITGSLFDGLNERHMVNVINDGAIPNLPDWALVEVPGFVGLDRIQPQHVGPLPDAIASICHTQATAHHLTVEAAMSGSRTLALQAMLVDPFASLSSDPEKMLDEMLKANRSCLAQFA